MIILTNLGFDIPDTFRGKKKQNLTYTCMSIIDKNITDGKTVRNLLMETVEPDPRANGRLVSSLITESVSSAEKKGSKLYTTHTLCITLFKPIEKPSFIDNLNETNMCSAVTRDIVKDFQDKNYDSATLKHDVLFSQIKNKETGDLYSFYIFLTVHKIQ